MSFDLRVRVPSGGRLVQDYLASAPSARTFYGSHFANPSAFERKAAEIDLRLTGDQRMAWLDGVRAPGERARQRLEAVRQGQGYVVTTGQQPGLLGGPLYSVYKAITAACLADHLEQQLGRPVVPVFWTASEDHDWQEADHAHWVDLENQLHRLTLPPVVGAGQQPLHRLVMGAGVHDVLDALAGMMTGTDLATAQLERLREHYRPEATLPDAFEGWLAALLEPLGVLFVQAHDRWLKQGSVAVLSREIERSVEHEQLLATRAAALEAAGYDVQVTILEGGLNVFLEGEGGRERIYRDGEGFHLRHSGQRFTPQELASALRDDPSRFSANVLSRPVVESAVLPTLAYVAGPGELAYFAQLDPLFEAHGIEMPVVVPRLGATVVEAKVDKVLRKFGLEISQMARPFHELAAERARDDMPEELRRALGAFRGAIGAQIGELTKAVQALDPTLKGTVGHVRSVAFDALDDVERKALHAVKRENEIALQQLEKAHVHLFPDGQPQERCLNALYYLSRYGPDFIAEVARRFAEALPVREGQP